MASRRPRVKVAANLSIRRTPKSTNAGEQFKAAEVDALTPEVKDASLKADLGKAIEEIPIEHVPTKISPKKEVAIPKLEKPDEQHFKLPQPVDDVLKGNSSLVVGVELSNSGGYNSNIATSNINNNNDEPMSQRKQEGRFSFPFPLSRKRSRTESLTSNKSLPEGVVVNRVTRKVATKQEESLRTLENKKEIRKRITNIVNVDKQNLTMFDMIYYNPVSNPMLTTAFIKRGSLESIPKMFEEKRSRSVSKSRSPTPAPVPPAIPKAPIQLTPQLKLGPNGEMILDESSLVIENEREKEIRETLASTDIVYQDEFSGNSGYYSRIRRTKEWTNDETIRFYRCLHTVGTDFSMMLELFPKRTRRDLKLKFKKEERLNLQLVNKALMHPKQFKLSELKQQFAKEDEELERIKERQQQLVEESAEKLRQERLNKKLMLKMSQTRNPKKRLSKSVRAMACGSEVGMDLEGNMNAASKTPKQAQVKVAEKEEYLDSLACSESVIKPIAYNTPPPVQMEEEGAVDSLYTNDLTLERPDTPQEPVAKPKHSVRKRGVSQVKHTKRKKKSSVCSEQVHSTEECNSPDCSTPTILDPAPYIPNGVAHAQTSDGRQDLLQSISSVIQNKDPQSCQRATDSSLIAPSSSLTLTEIKYDGAEMDLTYLPLPDLNAPVARQVCLDAEASHALDSSRAALMELEPVATATIAGQLVDEDAERSSAVLTSSGNSSNLEETASESTPSTSGYKLETGPRSPPPHMLHKTSLPDEESVAGHIAQDVCYVADEAIVHEDDDFCNAKMELPDTTKDGLLWETMQAEAIIEEISVGKEEVTTDEDCSSVSKIESSARRTIVEADLTVNNGRNVANEGLTKNDIADVVAANDEDGVGGAGAFSLEDIDINSLVLVESQDTSEPNKTFYEIYVANPETGQLSEKPLDVPADVIENIRAILESGGEGGS